MQIVIDLRVARQYFDKHVTAMVLWNKSNFLLFNSPLNTTLPVVNKPLYSKHARDFAFHEHMVQLFLCLGSFCEGRAFATAHFSQGL
jgi:hypothetical protein